LTEFGGFWAVLREIKILAVPVVASAHTATPSPRSDVEFPKPWFGIWYAAITAALSVASFLSHIRENVNQTQ
jgi:hypothetical protein